MSTKGAYSPGLLAELERLDRGEQKAKTIRVAAFALRLAARNYVEAQHAEGGRTVETTFATLAEAAVNYAIAKGAKL